MMDINKTWTIALGFYALLFFLMFQSALSMLYQWWGSKDYSYCFLILPIFAYMVWEKRQALRQVKATPSWIGLAPLMMGIFFFWVGELGGEYYTLYIASWLVVVGIFWIHLGWNKLKVIWFPIVFLLTMFPPPAFVYHNLSLRLKLISSKLGVKTLQLAGMTAYREGNVIDLGFTQLQVVDACNGLRYLFPLIVLAIVVAYFSKANWWQSSIAVVSAVPISILVNGLRIASVGLLYPIWGPQVVEGFFHDFSGWAIFMISLGVLLAELWALRKLSFYRQSKRPGAPMHPPVPGGPHIAPATKPALTTGALSFSQISMFVVAWILLASTVAVAHTVDFRKSVHIGKPFSQFPMRVGVWVGNVAFLEQNILDALDLSDYLLVNYKGPNNCDVNLYSAYYESQRKGESIHSPSSCLPGSGWEFHQSGKVNLQLNGRAGTEISVQRAFIQKGESRQLSYYWFPMRGRVLTNLWEIKLFNFWDALIRQRTDGALVRLTTPVYSGETVEKAEARLQVFADDIVPLLNEFLPQ